MLVFKTPDTANPKTAHIALDSNLLSHFAAGLRADDV